MHRRKFIKSAAGAVCLSAMGTASIWADEADGSQFALWTVGERPQKRVDFTDDVKLVDQALKRVAPTGGSTLLDALLEAPDVATPLGLRDRAMLELLYASGLRVSEIVQLPRDRVDLDSGFLRVTGKGGKERLTPFGACWAEPALLVHSLVGLMAATSVATVQARPVR